MRAMPLTIATWNVNGIRARQSQFAEWVGRDRPDVVCLQEIKARPDQVPQLVCNLDGYTCYWHGAGAYSGVALHVKKERCPLPAFTHPEFDMETRIVHAEVDGIVIASVYVPNGGKDFPAKMAFFEKLVDFAATVHASGRRLAICGDLNIAHTDQDLHPKERKAGVIGQRPDERAVLDHLLALGLVDVGRQLNPDREDMFSWWAPWRNMRQRNIGWRIDYILASAPLAERATSCKVLPDIGTSDHAPVVASFDV